MAKKEMKKEGMTEEELVGKIDEKIEDLCDACRKIGRLDVLLEYSERELRRSRNWFYFFLGVLFTSLWNLLLLISGLK